MISESSSEPSREQKRPKELTSYARVALESYVPPHLRSRIKVVDPHSKKPSSHTGSGRGAAAADSPHTKSSSPVPGSTNNSSFQTVAETKNESSDTKSGSSGLPTGVHSMSRSVSNPSFLPTTSSPTPGQEQGESPENGHVTRTNEAEEQQIPTEFPVRGIHQFSSPSAVKPAHSQSPTSRSQESFTSSTRSAPSQMSPPSRGRSVPSYSSQDVRAKLFEKDRGREEETTGEITTDADSMVSSMQSLSMKEPMTGAIPKGSPTTKVSAGLYYHPSRSRSPGGRPLSPSQSLAFRKPPPPAHHPPSSPLRSVDTKKHRDELKDEWKEEEERSVSPLHVSTTTDFPVSKTLTPTPSSGEEVDKDQQQNSVQQGMQQPISSPETVTPPQHPEKANPQACLFVASLSAAKSDPELFESVNQYFVNWGELVNVKVLRDYVGRPYAFVQFKNVDEAKRAMKEAHNTILDGRHIRIEQARVNRTLFLAKIDKFMSEEQVKSILSSYGPIEELTLLHDYNTGRSKGCGFVKFAYREDAMDAFAGLRGESKWVVEWATNLDRGSGLRSDADRCSVFVGQLNPAMITQELLEERFGQYGEMESVVLVNKTSPGLSARPAFAFIKYVSPDDAERAIQNENTQVWLDRTIRVQHREQGDGHVTHSRTASGASNFSFEVPAHVRQATYELPMEFFGPSPSGAQPWAAAPTGVVGPVGPSHPGGTGYIPGHPQAYMMGPGGPSPHPQMASSSMYGMFPAPYGYMAPEYTGYIQGMPSAGTPGLVGMMDPSISGSSYNMAPPQPTPLGPGMNMMATGYMQPMYAFDPSQMGRMPAQQQSGSGYPSRATRFGQPHYGNGSHLSRQQPPSYYPSQQPPPQQQYMSQGEHGQPAQETQSSGGRGMTASPSSSTENEMSHQETTETDS